MIPEIEQIEKQLRDKVGADMEREKWDIAAHDCLGRILRDKWEGKALNARIAKQFKEAFIPEGAREAAVVHYIRQYGHAELAIWGIGVYHDFNSRLVMTLASEREPNEPKYLGHYLERVVSQGWEYADCCNGDAAKERQKIRFELCQGDGLRRIAEAVHAQLAATEALEALTEHGTPGGQVRYAARNLSLGKAIDA